MRKGIISSLAVILGFIMWFGPAVSLATTIKDSKGRRRPVYYPLNTRSVSGSKSKPNAARVQASDVLPGQSVTLLSDGRSLLVGGEGAGGPQATVAISDHRTGNPIPLSDRLYHARAWHSATMLPDGRVLVLGGVGADGQVVDSAEVFYPESQTFELLPSADLPARAHHAATLLTDGHVLIMGGLSDLRRATGKAALWDFKTGRAVTLSAKLSTARWKHKATLLANGAVLVEGGVDANGNQISSAELFDVEAKGFNFTGAPSAQPDGGSPYLAASLPADGASDVPVDNYVALRFSKQLRVESVNRETVTLIGPEGTVETRVVPAENGKLAFVTPRKQLLPGVTYTVSLAGAVDESNQSLVSTAVTFTTEREQESDNQLLDSEDWIPDASNFHGNWRSKHKDSPWQSLPLLQAEGGVTALSGQALTLDGKPLAEVTLRIGDKTARTDNTGRFLLTPIPAGRHVMVIDGHTASRPRKVYGTFRVGVDITGGKTNALGYTVWMPKLDMANASIIPSPTLVPTSITTSRIPGLELRLPAGTVLRDVDGQTVTQVGITPIPTDRPPFPLPPGVDVPVYFTIQPGGAQIIPPRAQLVYPNFTGSRPGTRIDFWNYDATEKGWYVYGRGTVTADGRQIVPDPGVVLYEFSGAMVGAPSLAPLLGPLLGNPSDGDPVDLGTGLFVLDKADLFVRDTLPINLTRTYRPNDTVSRPFGIGATHPYEIFLVGDTFPYTYVDLILPDGGRVHYNRISSGVGFNDAVYESTSTPTGFYKSKISWNGHGWDLKLKDGSLYVFPEAFLPSRPSQAALIRIQDRYGNTLSLTRDAYGNLTKITSPNNRCVEFTYDSSYRITQAKDNIGRLVTYTYDTGGRLWKVTDPNLGVTEYTYDSSHRMLTVKDSRGIVYLTNEYDASGRVIKQTLADDTPGSAADNPTYQFSYTTNSGGKIIQTDVTDPRGNVRRVTFNSDGHAMTDTSALGKPEQQAVTLERQTGTNFVQAVIDTLGRRSEYNYDPMGNVVSVIDLAGTAAAATTSLTYEPAFNQVTGVTDPLNHATSYGYDSRGNLTSVTDPLNHQTTFAYNAAGQVISTTNQLQQTTQFVYDSGDLVEVRDPLSRSLSLFVDGAGRTLRVIDALGNATRYEYDGLNQVKKVAEQLGGVTEFTYDPNGNLLSLKDARNQVTTFSYDNMDRVLTRTDPLQGAASVERYEYDIAGNLTKLTDRRGKVTTLDYDGLDRPIFVGYGTAAGPTYESTTVYTYDAYDRATQVVDSASGAVTINYDDLARTASEVTPQGTVGYNYDKAGRLTTKTVTGQATITYSYDDGDRLLAISQGTGSVNFTYDDADRRATLTLPNGVVVEYGYDAASQLTGITYRNGAAVIGDLTYEYDKGGRRTKVGGSYARTGLPQALSGATYNAANQLTQRGAAALNYDANGNLTGDGVNYLHVGCAQPVGGDLRLCDGEFPVRRVRQACS